MTIREIIELPDDQRLEKLQQLMQDVTKLFKEIDLTLQEWGDCEWGYKKLRKLLGITRADLEAVVLDSDDSE